MADKEWNVFPAPPAHGAMDYSPNGAALDPEKKGKEPIIPVGDPFKDPIEQPVPVRERPFSEQTMMSGAVPPEYGKEHETTRTDHIEHVESNLVDPKTRNNKKQRLKRHCMRYWICYCCANIVLLAILLPILFLVIFPAIAQDLVNKQALELQSASLMDPAPDQMTFALNSSITVPKPFTVVLDPLNLSLFVQNYKPYTPYVYLELPKNKLHGNASIKLAPQRANIANQDQWLGFLNESVYNENVVLSAKGTSMGHFGKLKAKLELNKNVNIKGLNKLQGFSVAAAQLLIPEDSAGHNLKATLSVPNHSPVAFQLGNQSFNLKIQDLTAGLATIYDLTLVPGNNSAVLLGSLDFGVLIDNLQYVINASSEALTAGNIRLWTTGNSTIYNGQHIPYYEKILGGLELVADVPLTNLIVGSLGGYLNETSAELQNIVNEITPALLNGSIAISTLQAALQQAYNNGTGSLADIALAVGTVFSDAGSGNIGGLFTALGAAAAAVASGVATSGQILAALSAAGENGIETITNIISALNLAALIPTTQTAST